MKKQYLRYVTATIVADYYDPKNPEIKSLTVLIGWLESHLNGIPFSQDYDPYISGDYDPRRPTLWLSDMYKCYQIDGQPETAETIKKIIESPDLTPSKALRILHDNWQFYSSFPTINRCIEYCVLCVKNFPETQKSWQEFHRAVNQIHLTLV